MKKIIIGSRESKLAIIQSEMVQTYIREHNPDLPVEILTMKTTGDRILNQPLEKIGGKGLFVKELDCALLECQTDLSVHSLKDVPMEIPKELPLIAFSKREDARDVLVLPEGMTEIDFSKPIGCSSMRRMVQFQMLFPQARFAPIRGNVQTRLKKIDEGQYSATILAAAGLKRLGLQHRISRYFSVEEIIPAAGQGILAVQGRAGEDYSFLREYSDTEATACALAERAFVRRLGGGCSTPSAAYAEITPDGRLVLRGMYFDESGRMSCGQGEERVRYQSFVFGKTAGTVCVGTEIGGIEEPEKIGERLALRFLREASLQGRVWLVGAGPGDSGLFTLKGKQVLMNAEVVVYDALVGPGIIQMIPATAERIYVGKHSGKHTMEQEEINCLLVKKALAGKRVVRLKGGDPFLFGRGGEEMEALAKNKIPYEVIPGIPSAIAVPAYQGIPVTHRDFVSSVHIITGHSRADTCDSIDSDKFVRMKGTCHYRSSTDSRLDYDALVRAGGTLVFLMGVSALGEICRGLLMAGMKPEMPAALLMRGTTTNQERIVATVATLEQTVAEKGAKTPAVIVVGKVCALSEKFSWAEKLPFSGIRIFLTRPRERMDEIADRLRLLGAEVLECPAIRTVKRKNNAVLYEALKKIREYQWLAFTSPTGVSVFFEELQAFRADVRKLGGVKIACIGKGTAKELWKHGIYPDLMPEVFDGAHLGAALFEASSPGDRILIPRAADGNPELVCALAGRSVSDIPTYDTVYETKLFSDWQGEFSFGKNDYVFFTSASTVHGFVAALRAVRDKTDTFPEIKAVCIGTQTTQTAKSYGMQTHTASQATIESMIDCLLTWHL